MSISGLRSRDVVEVDIRGRRFYASVDEVNGRVVRFKAHDKRHTERECTSHQIVGIWKATKDTRRAKGLE